MMKMRVAASGIGKAPPWLLKYIIYAIIAPNPYRSASEKIIKQRARALSWLSIYNLLNNSPQRTQRTQSCDNIVFATFAVKKKLSLRIWKNYKPAPDQSEKCRTRADYGICRLLAFMQTNSDRIYRMDRIWMSVCVILSILSIMSAPRADFGHAECAPIHNLLVSTSN